MSIILYGTNGFINSNQTTNIYLEDYNGNITKQHLIDIILSEVYDNRDGEILKHINNIIVEITRKNDNVIIDSINTEGFYDIMMSCLDSDNNLGNIFFRNRNVSLDVDVLTLLVREDKPPLVAINDIRLLKLSDYQPDYLIDRTDLNSLLVYKVIDDRDGIITTDILNVKIFQTAEQTTSGGFIPTYYDGTNGVGIMFDTIPTTELLYIEEIGEYFMRLTVNDSSGGNTTIADFTFDVFD